MALTALQRRICLLLAEQRRRSGEGYVAGDAALNEVVGGTRKSRDVDLFHDTEEALAVTWRQDRAALAAAGLRLEVTREAPTFVQATVGDGSSTEILQWVQHSAYRFFPLVEDQTFGLTLHPLDHATNKILALAGRRKVRDWVDAIQCHQRLQPLGYLAWAASGKDPWALALLHPRAGRADPLRPGRARPARVRGRAAHRGDALRRMAPGRGRRAGAHPAPAAGAGRPVRPRPGWPAAASLAVGVAGGAGRGAGPVPPGPDPGRVPGASDGPLTDGGAARHQAVASLVLSAFPHEVGVNVIPPPQPPAELSTIRLGGQRMWKVQAR